MKNLQYSSDIRLTDALERELLKAAIDAQQEYALDRAMKQLFRKAVSLFTGPEVRIHTIARTAH